MSSRGTVLTGTPADLIGYQNDMVRTKKYLPIGRINKIAIGPTPGWKGAGDDPFMLKFGRLIDLRNRFLPIAESMDSTMLLITAPLLAKSAADGQFHVALPDVPDPSYRAPVYTPEETGYRADGSPLNPKYPGQPAGWSPKHKIEATLQDRQAPMLPQRLEDRAEGWLEGTNFLVFSPVLKLAFQPELNGQMQAAMDTIECLFDMATKTYMTLLVDPKTGESHFYGGRYERSVTD